MKKRNTFFQCFNFKFYITFKRVLIFINRNIRIMRKAIITIGHDTHSLSIFRTSFFILSVIITLMMIMSFCIANVTIRISIRTLENRFHSTSEILVIGYSLPNSIRTLLSIRFELLRLVNKLVIRSLNIIICSRLSRIMSLSFTLFDISTF